MLVRKAKVQARIGDLLLSAGLIDQSQLHSALLVQKETRCKLGSALVSIGAIDEKILSAFLALQQGLETLQLAERNIPAEILALVKPDTARRLGAIPIERMNTKLHVALIDPKDRDAIKELELESGFKIKAFIAPQSSIRRALLRYYPERRVVEPKPPQEKNIDLAGLRTMVAEARKTLETVEKLLAE